MKFPDGTIQTTASATSIDALSDAISSVPLGTVFLGTNAGVYTTGQWNTGVGINALSSITTTSRNTAIGAFALASSTSAQSTATGFQSLYKTTSGTNNTATGMNALYGNITGSQNTAIGMQALQTNTTGSNNTAIGYQADVASGALTNATAIGNGATVNASNMIVLGNASVTQVVTAGDVCSDNAAYGHCIRELYAYLYSDQRLKENIQPLDSTLSRVMQLKPITFNWNKTFFDFNRKVPNATSTKIGFIAQDVQKIFPELVNPVDDKGYYTLNYDKFAPVVVSAIQEVNNNLVNSVKELKTENDTLNDKIEKLQADNEALLSRIEKIEAKLR